MGKSVENNFRDLAFELIEPAIRRRVVMETLPKEIRRRGKRLLGIQEDPPVPRERPVGVGKCYLCGRARNKSTRKTCEVCLRWVCPDHQKTVCNDCIEQIVSQKQSGGVLLNIRVTYKYLLSQNYTKYINFLSSCKQFQFLFM